MLLLLAVENKPWLSKPQISSPKTSLFRHGPSLLTTYTHSQSDIANGSMNPPAARGTAYAAYRRTWKEECALKVKADFREGAAVKSKEVKDGYM